MKLNKFLNRKENIISIVIILLFVLGFIALINYPTITGFEIINQNDFSITDAPTHDTPVLSSTSGNNLYTDNLTVTAQNIQDTDGDSVTTIINWYKNGTSITVLNMPFSSNNSAGSGNTKDYTNFSNNGTVSGAIWNSTAGNNNTAAYEFDGIDDYINISNDQSLNFTKNNITIVAWIKPEFSPTIGAVNFYEKLDSNDLTIVANSNFGSSVSEIGDLDGDGITDLAVGAYDDSDGGTAVGAIYILFMNINGSISSYEKINDTTMDKKLHNYNWFGSGISNIGDLDGDGITDLAVGAYGDDDGDTQQGAVYILFLDTDGSVSSFAKINDTSVDDELVASDHFGRSVANIGDLDGDGITDLAVGAYDDDDGGTNAGSVYILFLNTDGSVSSYEKINDTDIGDGLEEADDFGWSVANMGDLDSDGVIDLAVGVPYDDDGDTNAGAVWLLFMDTDGSVKSYEKINDTSVGGGLAAGDYFGSGISSIGDLNNDNITDLAVGAYGDDDGDNFAGAVWLLFMDTDGSVSSYAKINDTSVGGGLAIRDYFGSGISNIGDLDGDSVIDLAVGTGAGGQPTDSLWILSLSDGLPAIINKQTSYALKANETDVRGVINGTSITTSINLNEWNHIAFTYNGTTQEIYVNGNLSLNKSLTTDFPHNIYDTYIGKYFNGTIDEVMIFNHTLSAEQINALYQNKTNLIVSQETSIDDIWQACITPNDGTDDGTEKCSNTLTLIESVPEEEEKAGIISKPAPPVFQPIIQPPAPQPPAPKPTPAEKTQQQTGLPGMNVDPGLSGILNNLLLIDIDPEPRIPKFEIEERNFLINLENETNINIDFTAEKPSILIIETIALGTRPKKPTNLLRNIIIALILLLIFLYLAIKQLIQIKKKLKKEKFRKKKLLTQEIVDVYETNKLISRFNKLSELIKQNINNNNLDTASKQYQKLLTVYKFLIFKLNKEDQSKLYSSIKEIYSSLKNSIKINYLKRNLKK